MATIFHTVDEPDLAGFGMVCEITGGGLFTGGGGFWIAGGGVVACGLYGGNSLSIHAN
jgi:hypothetical protein